MESKFNWTVSCSTDQHKRDAKSGPGKLRFRKWTCTHCQHMTELCPACKKPCLLEKKFHTNLKNLYASIDSLSRLPRRREEGHGLSVPFVMLSSYRHLVHCCPSFSSYKTREWGGEAHRGHEAAAEFIHRCRTGVLCEMRKMTLSKLPYWTWSSSDDRTANWWRTLHHIQAHVKETGTLPPIRSKLGSWLDHEKGKKTGNRTVEQKIALQDLIASSNNSDASSRVTQTSCLE